jgi:hypothetical protein
MEALNGIGIHASVGVNMFTFAGEKMCGTHIHMSFYEAVFALCNAGQAWYYAYKLLV